jgi:hypothetical protein
MSVFHSSVSKVRLPPAADGSSSIGTASGGKIIRVIYSPRRP